MELPDFWTVCRFNVALCNQYTVFQKLRYFLGNHGNCVFFVARTVRFDQIKNCLLVAHLMKYEVTSESLGFVTIFPFEILLPQIPLDDMFIFRYHGN